MMIFGTILEIVFLTTGLIALVFAILGLLLLKKL